VRKPGILSKGRLTPESGENGLLYGYDHTYRPTQASYSANKELHWMLETRTLVIGFWIPNKTESVHSFTHLSKIDFNTITSSQFRFPKCILSIVLMREEYTQ
jgi:hypothetical protein